MAPITPAPAFGTGATVYVGGYVGDSIPADVQGVEFKVSESGQPDIVVPGYGGSNYADLTVSPGATITVRARWVIIAGGLEIRLGWGDESEPYTQPEE